MIPLHRLDFEKLVINGPTSADEADGFACDEDAFNARVIRLPSFITPYLSANLTLFRN